MLTCRLLMEGPSSPFWGGHMVEAHYIGFLGGKCAMGFLG